jgi:DNA (cytosine-5)-methyltransferase 1
VYTDSFEKMGYEVFNYIADGQMTMFEKEKSEDWKWEFKDYPIEKNGLKVFSCFACGGGSTMGYKLAGCEVIGNVEIDPKMNEIYIKNHNPRFNYLMDIRDFNKLDNLPEELYNIDILDGSPPCTTFSMAGQREESWGKKKKFREGQAEQTLDDLSFVFIETVNKLRPKIVIMENVEGLTKGSAWGYVQDIYKQFNKIGYSVKHWLLKGEEMGIPQKRHRVFFIATKLNFNLETIDFNFNYDQITYGKIKSGIGREIGTHTQVYKMISIANTNDLRICDVFKRIGGKEKCFGAKIAWECNVLQTITAKLDYYRGVEKTTISLEDIIAAQTFPMDYFFGEKTWANVSYFCGMSVPPIMIKRIVLRLLQANIFITTETVKL